MEMRQKLLLKKFPKNEIEEKVEKMMIEIEDWENFRFNITRNIENKIGRGKSIAILKNELLGKFPYFKEEIQDLLASYDDTSALKKEAEKYAQKYDLSNKSEEQKFYAALIRKGFHYKEIKNYLQELRENF